MADRALFLLQYVVFPAWVAAGLADWACHRATRIAQTSGLPENAFHWAMYLQMGVVLAGVAALETNGAVLALVAGGFLVHELLVWAELRYTVPRREVRPVEQMVHSFLELLPLVMLALLAVAAGAAALDMAPRLRAQPWPPAALAGAVALTAALNALPLAQETLACLRRRTRPSPAPR